mgnify:CR=1 FL=1|tara:strand:+ start:34882 stop:36606 length:1725 start_codon:yes stop_codon:yes gene_type:complete
MLSNSYIKEVEMNNKSGKMFLEKYILKHYPKDHELILNYCTSNNLNDIPFKEKVYHTLNDIPYEILCGNPNCENSVKFHNSTIGYKNYCSTKCAGTDYKTKKKREETNIKKFGTKHASLNKEVMNKVKDIYNERTDEYKQSILDKRINTVNDRYGVDNVNKVDKIIKKRVESFKENVEIWKENYKKTSLKRYGVEHPWMDKGIHDKTIESSLDQKIKSYTEKIIEKLPNKYQLINVINKKNINNRLTSIIKCPNCLDTFEINNSLLYDRTVRNKTEICTKCNPINRGISGLEIQFLNFIKSNYDGEIITNGREIITPYEIDIYLPDLNLAFEFNGLYWHSELNKDKNYHYLKSKMCEEKDIQLIHIWEDDWVFKNDIICSMILNKLNKSNKIYGRKTEVRIITDNKLIRKFLNENHIQGFVGSKIKLGLFFNDELVSLMTFGGLRRSMGYEPTEGDFELMRFCNKLNHSVIGGASKLFKYFTKKYKYNTILSYSDNSYSNGNLYINLGFELEDKETKLNYYWVIDNKREHRYNYRKSNLIQKGYNKNKSEREIMYEDVGSYRIWGSGNKKWIKR